ncbi:MAG: DUF1801 domain-containing protein [Xanthomonadales bacterium]|nr:DUF1801 domain-containing protein [Xanthomonadales bacterium]
MSGEPKTRPTSASVPDFLARQPKARRADCEAVCAMMQAATGEPPVMWGEAIVGFGRYAYTNTSRKSFEWPLVAFSPRKNDLTLYIMPGFDAFAGLIAKLGRHKTGKSCLYIKQLADVDAGVLRGIIDGSVRAMAPKRIRG